MVPVERLRLFADRITHIGFLAAIDIHFAKPSNRITSPAVCDKPNGWLTFRFCESIHLSFGNLQNSKINNAQVRGIDLVYSLASRVTDHRKPKDFPSKAKP
jgi:hypothetical protein